MNKKKFYFALILFLTFCFLTSDSFSQQIINKNKKIIVGTKEAPPFSFKDDDGSWSGISIDLWKEIALRLNIKYELKEFNLTELLKAVESNKIDVAVAALTITPEREKYLDFSHAFYVDGLGIAVPNSDKGSWFMALKKFVSFQFLSVITVLGIILLIFGYLIWLFEHKKNKGQFDQNVTKGLGDGFWWSAVTMTTVGYGDKAPQTLGGRIIGIIWMFTSVIIISSFTAAITSAVTVSQLASKVNGPEDLINVTVGTVHDSASAKILEQRKIHCEYFDSLKEALDQLNTGQIDAVVYDAPLLQYIINKDFKNNLRVLSNTFIDQPYGLAFPTGSPMIERVNQSLLEIVNSSRWQEILDFYLGKH